MTFVRYILSYLVYKQNKDITTNLTMHPPGHMRVGASNRKEKALEGKWAAAKADCLVEKTGSHPSWSSFLLYCNFSKHY
jgi:hypothetical protein